MSDRLLYLKIMGGMTNIITAVILIIFLMPRTLFLVSTKIRPADFSKSGRVWMPVTFANDDIMTYKWKKLQVTRPLRSR